MKAIINFCTIVVCWLCCFSSFSLFSQVTIDLSVISGTSTTTCDDGIFGGAPDPLWQVNVEGEGVLTYPANGPCFNTLPNVQYSNTIDCFLDIPATIEVCFTAFENDGLVIPIIGTCDIAAECSETICQDFNVPIAGTTEAFSLSLPNNLSSGGTVNFEIAVSEDMSNNFICNAIDLGVVNAGTIIGDSSIGAYSNVCSNDDDNIETADFGIFEDDHTVWFSFTTGPDVGPELLIDVTNDPENTGDLLDVQIALFETSDGTCTGIPSLVDHEAPINSLDAFSDFRCVQPNTTYYLLVDGGYFDPSETLTGVFGLQLTNVVATEGSDTPCGADNLGVVPEGGSTSLNGFYSNFCATGIGDINIPAFGVQASVWFRFTPPSSGHVLVEATAESGGIDPLDIQMAVLRSFGSCTGVFIHLESGDNTTSPDQSLEVSCLYDDEEYWILVDGATANQYGTFTLSVTDAGDITPIEVIDTTICAGDSYTNVGSTYTDTGTYFDTIPIFFACDSVIQTNLTVLDSIEVTINQSLPAVNQGGMNGQAEVSATGGDGNYSFAWCTGETGNTSGTLIGGEQCCITVTDGFGCEVIECFTVDFVTEIIPAFENDTLLCNGDTDGIIVFSGVDGYPPYTYTWEKNDGTISGNGTIMAADDEVTLPNLPAGDYTITITDLFFDTTFVASVTEPSLVEVIVDEVAAASCFGICDGTIRVSGIGGTGNYTFAWSNGSSSAMNIDLCAGDYTVTVTDENDCEAEMMITITEPEEFIATAIQTQAVSCFEGGDGQATVTTNGNPIAFDWETGNDTPEVVGLSAGTYMLTVTNEDGCLDTTFVEITEPDSPVSVQIAVANPISCAGEADGSLLANVNGPGISFSYNWTNGSTEESAIGLSSAEYGLTVSNELGCEAMASVFFDEPLPIQTAISAIDITCLDPENGGIILIDTVTGGNGGYEYSLDGVIFSAASGFFNLFEGGYEIVIRDEKGCEEVFPATVLGPPELVVDLGMDMEITQGEIIDLVAIVNSSNNLVYNWAPSDTAAIIADSILSAQLIESTIFQVMVEDTVSFCTASDQIIVTVNRDRKIFMANAFSPNNDGANDKFMVQSGAGVVQVKSFRIFDRNGAMVFEQTNFQPNDPDFGWDGQFNGRALNTGVYVFMAEIEFIDGLTEVFKGDVMLMR